MPNDPTLKNLFGSAQPSSELDVDLILRRARRRRLPKQLAAGGVLSLAIGGIAVASVQGFAASPEQSSVALDSSTSSELAPLSSDDAAGTFTAEGSEEIKRSPADRINLCGGTLAEVAPSQTGLVVETHFDDADASSSEVRGTVTLTNTGDATVSGTSGTWVAITLSQDGIVKWHTNGAHDMMGREVDLAPGDSIDYEARFEPVSCDVEDDLGESFRADLPTVPAGEYQVSAALDVVVDSNAELVTGPLETVTLR